MKNEDLFIEKKEKIRKFLIKVGITNEKVSEGKIRMLKFWDNNAEKLSKPTEEEKQKLHDLKYFYKRDDEENLMFTEKIFKLHKDLLNSVNPKIRREALEMVEKIMEKYKPTMVEILQNLPIKK